MLYFKLRMLKRGGRGGTSGSASRRSAASGSMMGSAGSTAGPGGVSAATAAAVSNAAPASPAAATAAPTPAPAAPVGPATNPTTTSNAVARLAAMDDSSLANVLKQAQNTGLPNQLDDIPDATQKFTFVAGVNEKPIVLDQAGFDQFMKKNGISKSEIMIREVNPVNYTNKSNTSVKMTAQDIVDMTLYSRYNYIGGKRGGQAVGAGTYFDMTGGRSSGYGNTTITAVLNPKTAKVIDTTTLQRKVSTWRRSNPKSANQIDSLVSQIQSERRSRGINVRFSPDDALSIYAVAMGYNVIKDVSYYNVIDRSALVIKA